MEEIDDGESLYRRLISYSVQNGKVLPNAYYDRRRKPDPEISVYIARLTSPEAVLGSAPPGFRLGRILAGVPRSQLGLTVQHVPLPDDYAHAQIEGVTTKQECYLLAEHTELLPDRGRSTR